MRTLSPVIGQPRAGLSPPGTLTPRNYGKPLANGREDPVIMRRHWSQKIILKNNIVVIETSTISCYYLLN